MGTLSHISVAGPNPGSGIFTWGILRIPTPSRTRNVGSRTRRPNTHNREHRHDQEEGEEEEAAGEDLRELRSACRVRVQPEDAVEGYWQAWRRRGRRSPQ